MTQEEVFLQSIIEAPDDDLPRLAYADWLEEQGHPRGEFIHVQIDLARLPADDPRRLNLHRREQELLQRHAWEWAEPLGERIREWMFERGFIERVSTSLEVPAADLQFLLQQAPIRHLRDEGQVCELQGVVDACPHLGKLLGLEFWGLYAFDDILLRRILLSPHLANLRTLILHHDRNGNLADDDVIIDGVVSPFRENLEELAVNIDGCWRGPSAQVVRAIARSPSLKKLRRLTLSHAELDLPTVYLLERSRNLPRLKHLDLGNCRTTAAVWDAVLEFVEGRNLSSLRLAGADVVDEEGSFIASLDDHYMEAFEEIADVDWESEFISPWGEGCWSGFSWQGRRRAALREMDRFLRARDYSGLETAYRRRCVETNGEAAAGEIDALRFDEYTELLRPEFEQAVASLEQNEGQTVIYHLRPEMEWESKVSVEELEPTPLLGGAGGPSLHRVLADFPGPDFPEAARIYSRHPFRRSIHPSGPALYLIARALAAFARLASRYDVPAPLGFRCLDALFQL